MSKFQNEDSRALNYIYDELKEKKRAEEVLQELRGELSVLRQYVVEENQSLVKKLDKIHLILLLVLFGVLCFLVGLGVLELKEALKIVV